MGLWMIPAAIGLGKTLYGASKAKKNKPPLAEHTFAGRQLAKYAKEGVLSPAKMSAINTLMHTQSGGVSNIAQGRIRGQLARSGMDQSIAATTPIARLESERMRNIGQAGTTLGLINAQSKQDSAINLAMMKDQSRTDRRNWREGYTDAVAGGLAGAATSAVGGLQEFQADQYMEDAMSRIMPMMNSNNPQDLQNALAFITMLQSGTEFDLSQIGGTSTPTLGGYSGQAAAMGGD